MNLEIFILNGYGQYVWPAFLFSFLLCTYLYFKTKKELKEQEKINQSSNITFLKTHNAVCKINGNRFTNSENTLGAIYIVRDPRNVITSLAHHYQISK